MINVFCIWDRYESLEARMPSLLGLNNGPPEMSTREFHKNFCFIDYMKAFDCVDHNKLENS